MQKIAQSYETFGILLLNDEDGSTVASLSMPNQTPYGITMAILRKWLQGEGRKPTSWATLITVIEEAGFGLLDWEITAGLQNLR